MLEIDHESNKSFFLKKNYHLHSIAVGEVITEVEPSG